MAMNLTLVLCDNMLVSSSTLAAEIFNFASAMARASSRQAGEVTIRRVSTDDLPVQTSSGFELSPTHSLEDTFQSDLVHLPALWRNPRPIVKRARALHQRKRSFFRMRSERKSTWATQAL